ncbi:OmpA family protein [Nannocystaceae bacterium ST9]
MNFHRLLLVGSSFALLMACVHTAPTELVDARTAYERASKGPSKKYTPAELHVAKTSLQVAERSFADDEDSMIVRNQAYVAMRKAELAESMARTEMYTRGISASETKEEWLEDEDAKKTKAELADATDALDDEMSASAVTARELAAEKKLRADAEKRAAQSAADLARIAAVKQDDRGMVITLSGSVLFASSRYVLLPAAEEKLIEVAEALLAGDPAATFVVEGHTDSQGKAEDNQVLSVNRANAVRDFLIRHDIAADRITAEGHGEDQTVGDNKSAEGRANNRRVEIVVKPGKGG